MKTASCVRIILAASLLAAMGLANQASAQSASFCSDKVVADTFYSTVSSNGKSSRVDYFMQLRNATSAAINYSGDFTNTRQPPITDRLAPSAKILAAHASVKIKLGTQTFNNPSGQGKLDGPDLKASTRINCR